MIERKKTKEVRIGNIMVGGDHAVTVQSMTTTKTHDVTATLKEVERLEEAGCHLIRITVPDQPAADALKEIKKRMKLKKEIQDSKDNQISKTNDITMGAKKELLPLLKNIEALTNQRDNHLKKINLIDEELEKVKSNIISIKDSYEKNISELKNNINFFEQSISLINNIKGEE